MNSQDEIQHQYDLILRHGFATSAQLRSALSHSNSGDLASRLHSSGQITTEQLRQLRALLASKAESLPLMPHAPEAFETLGLLGKGGMGEVYAVHDRRFQRSAALKVLAPENDEPAAIARFTREAAISARLNHPGIPAIYEYGRARNGQPYILMQLVRGETLEQRLSKHADDTNSDQHRTNRSQRIEIFLQICDTIAAAHSQGVIHRDLKPTNIMLGERGEVFVMDWGLARVENQGTAWDSQSSEGLDPMALTKSGAILGTPGYMAPEQANGERVDFEADVFALGAILHELLTGARAIASRSTLDMLQDTIQGHFSRPRDLDPNIPTELDAIVHAAMLCDPRRRLPGPAVLAARIRAWRTQQMSRADSPTRAVKSKITVLVALALSVATSIAWRDSRAKNSRLQTQLLEIQNTADLSRGTSAEQSREIQALRQQIQSSEYDLENSRKLTQATIQCYRTLATSSFNRQAILDSIHAVLRDSQASPIMLLSIGESALAVQALEEAIQAFSRALEINPHLHEARFLRMLAQGPWSQERSIQLSRELLSQSPTVPTDQNDPLLAFARTSDLDPNDPKLEALLLRARQAPSLTAMASIWLAKLAQEKVIHGDPLIFENQAVSARADHPDLLMELIRLSQKRGDWLRSLFLSSQITNIQNSEANRLLRATILLELSTYENQKYRFTRAAEHELESILAEDPENRCARARLIQGLLTRPISPKLQQSFNALLPIAPNEAPLQAVRGVLAMNSGQYNEAIEAFLLAVDKGLPDDTLIHESLALAFSRQNLFKEAELWARKGLDLDPQNARLLLRLAQILRFQQRLTEALQFATRAQKLTPEDQHLAFELAHIYTELQQPHEAARHFEQSWKLSIYQNDQALENACKSYFEAKLHDKALSLLQSDTDSINRTAERLILEGTFHIAMKNYAPALAVFEAACAIAPKNPTAVFYRARALAELDRLSEALIQVDALLSIDPDNEEALFLRACILVNSNRQDEGTAILTRLAERGKSGRMRRTAAARLKELEELSRKNQKR